MLGRALLHNLGTVTAQNVIELARKASAIMPQDAVGILIGPRGRDLIMQAESENRRWGAAEAETKTVPEAGGPSESN